MSTESPQVGQVSADGQFRWNGAEWAPLARGHREPTSWTLPLRRVAAGYLLVSALLSILTTALFVTPATIERSLRASNSNLTADQAHSAAALGYVTGWAVVAIIAAVMLVLAVGSYLGWRWAFWVDLPLLALTSVGVVTNLFALQSPATQSVPQGATILSFLLSVAALALLVWLIVAAVRYGPWAMRRPGVQ